MSTFICLAAGCATAAVIATFQHADARFASLMWAILAVAASVLAVGVR